MTFISTHRFTQILLLSASLSILNGCIEVDDDGNEAAAVALQEQNEILREQLDQSQQTNTVSFTGVVVNADEREAPMAATVLVRTANKIFADNISTTNGQFTVSGLPADSSIEVVLSSDSNDFLTRAYFLNTGNSTSGEAEKDFGEFRVSRGQEHEISILKAEDNMPITGLEFVANSSVNTGSNSDSYLHKSTFDDVNGVYKITLPTEFNIRVSASLDLDKDGTIDYEPETGRYVSGLSISLFVNELSDLPELLFSEPQDQQANLSDIQFRIAIVDQQANPLAEAKVMIQNEIDESESTYDAASGQHVLDTKLKETFNRINLEIPAFTANDVNYASMSISLNENSDGVFSVRIDGSSNFSRYDIVRKDLIELVAAPQEIVNPVTDLEVVFRSDPSLATDNSLTVFYSQAVAVAESSISLFDLDAVSVTKGNDSDTDIVLPGTTLVTGGETKAVAAAMSLNNTKLTVTPSATLQADREYRYNVSTLQIIGSAFDVDVNGDDSVSFTTQNIDSNKVFEITDIKLDNQNYYTNGNLINAVNTAGVDSSSFERRRNTYLYLPDSISQLKTLEINQTGYVENNVARLDFRTYAIVRNGQIQSNDKVILISLAENENLVTSELRTNVITGTALADVDAIYRYGSLEYLADDKAGSTNSISFEYAYETKAGEIVTGTITLPVL